MRELTIEELNLISGGSGGGGEEYDNEDIVVTGSPYPPPYYPPYYPPPYYPPPSPYYPPYYPPPPAPPIDSATCDVDCTEAGEIDALEQAAIANLVTAKMNAQSYLANISDSFVFPIPASFNLPPLTGNQLEAAAANIDFKIVTDDGYNNGGVGSTQGTFDNPLFVLETNGPNGNGLTQWGQSINTGEIYMLHELAHLTPAAQQFYGQQMDAWRSANPGQADSGFNGTPGWVATEAFAWSIARTAVTAGGGSWTYQPAEGFLW